MSITLRIWNTSDLESLLELANNPRVAANMTNAFPYPFTEEIGKGFIERNSSEQPARIMAIDLEGKAIGAIGIHPRQDIECQNAELGYWLGEPYWGRGIMTKALQEMVSYGFANFPVSRLFARPFGSNKGSQKALERAGFTLEARFEKTFLKNGVQEDELVYAIRKSANPARG